MKTFEEWLAHQRNAEEVTLREAWEASAGNSADEIAKLRDALSETEAFCKRKDRAISELSKLRSENEKLRLFPNLASKHMQINV